MALVRSYGARAAHISKGCVCQACNSLTCFGCWILLALCGSALIVWGTIQIHTVNGHTAYIAAIASGVALILLSLVLMIRACVLEHNRNRVERIEVEPSKPTQTRIATIA